MGGAIEAEDGDREEDQAKEAKEVVQWTARVGASIKEISLAEIIIIACGEIYA